MGVAARVLVPLRRAVSVGLAVVALVAAIPDGAGAVTTCLLDDPSDTLTVTMSATGDASSVALGPSGEIQVRGGGPVLPCGATTANTDTINVVDGSGSNGNTRVSVFDLQGLAPLDLILAFGGGSQDDLAIFGDAAPAVMTLGSGGVNVDNDATADINFFGSVPENIQFFGGAGADTLRARGGAGTGGAPSVSFIEIAGAGGNDTLEGSEGGDLLRGDAGSDTMRGFGGEDGLIGDELTQKGDDVYEGGAGSDTISFPLIENGIYVDLEKQGPQASGEGNDSFAEIENVVGTRFDDVLVGDAGPNSLRAGIGDDNVDGRGGNDVMSGSTGTDTLTYAGSPAGVVVDLGAGTASGGYGTDELEGFENLLGSPFADALTGSAEANAIVALGGADTVQALGGADLVDVRDGGADNASCGSEVDTAIADRLSLDTVQADCELVNALPEPGSGTGGGGGGGSGAGSGAGGSGSGGSGGADPGSSGGKPSGEVVFSLRAAKRQPLLAQGGLLVKLRCPREACTVAVRATGRRLKPVTVRLAPGATKTAKLRIRKGKREALRNLLLGGGKLKLRVTATATDAAGNTAPAQLVVRAKPPRALS